MNFFKYVTKHIDNICISGFLIALTFFVWMQYRKTSSTALGSQAISTSEPSLSATELACSKSKDSSHIQKAIKYVNGGGVLRKIGDSKYKQAVRDQIFFACEPPQDFNTNTTSGNKFKGLGQVSLEHDYLGTLGIIKDASTGSFLLGILQPSQVLDVAGRPIKFDTSIENIVLNNGTTLISLFEVNLVEQPPSLMGMMGIKLNGSTDYLVQIYDTKGTLSTKKDDTVKIGVLDVAAKSMVVIDEYSPDL